jgi:hypothetical protein
MQNIIEPIEKNLLKSELEKDKFLCKTNKANNEIYIITAHDSPETMKEIGRLREISFRSAGGGTGKALDIDNFDIMKNPYKQLIVWNPEAEEIVGGYRFFNCEEAEKQGDGQFELATAELFEFSENFIKNYLPYTIELGRSFVQPAYQPSRDSRKGIYSLDNLWDGLGALVVKNPRMKYYFGKITMYPSFNQLARDLIHYFLLKHFPDKDNLVYPHKSVPIKTHIDYLKNSFSGNSYAEDYAILNKLVRANNENIPPLVNAYMSLSSTMKSFGTSINDSFGDVEETGIIISIEDIYPQKSERYIKPFLNLRN